MYLQGNDATERIANVWGSYRKHMLASVPALTYQSL